MQDHAQINIYIYTHTPLLVSRVFGARSGSPRIMLITHFVIVQRDSPALNHDLIDGLWASRRGRKPIARVNFSNSLLCVVKININQLLIIISRHACNDIKVL